MQDACLKCISSSSSSSSLASSASAPYPLHYPANITISYLYTHAPVRRMRLHTIRVRRSVRAYDGWYGTSTIHGSAIYLSIYLSRYLSSYNLTLWGACVPYNHGLIMITSGSTYVIYVFNGIVHMCIYIHVCIIYLYIYEINIYIYIVINIYIHSYLNIMYIARTAYVYNRTNLCVTDL